MPFPTSSSANEPPCLQGVFISRSCEHAWWRSSRADSASPLPPPGTRTSTPTRHPACTLNRRVVGMTSNVCLVWRLVARWRLVFNEPQFLTRKIALWLILENHVTLWFVFLSRARSENLASFCDIKFKTVASWDDRVISSYTELCLVLGCITEQYLMDQPCLALLEAASSHVGTRNAIHLHYLQCPTLSYF